MGVVQDSIADIKLNFEVNNIYHILEHAWKYEFLWFHEKWFVVGHVAGELDQPTCCITA